MTTTEITIGVPTESVRRSSLFVVLFLNGDRNNEALSSNIYLFFFLTFFRVVVKFRKLSVTREEHVEGCKLREGFRNYKQNFRGIHKKLKFFFFLEK